MMNYFNLRGQMIDETNIELVPTLFVHRLNEQYETNNIIII